jgi:hypothetical protein
MKRYSFDFPHPVMYSGNDDYVTGEFVVNTISAVEEEDQFRFEFQYELGSVGLQNMVETSQVDVVLKVECAATSFRTLHTFDKDKSLKFTIGKNEVADKMVTTGYLVAKTDITNFYLADHNPDYYSAQHSFKINSGEILAFEDGARFYFDASELEKPVSSIISIVEYPDDRNENVSVSYDDEKIKILLDKNTFATYVKLKNNDNLKKFLIGTLVYPVLVEAVHKVATRWSSESEDDIEDKRWYRNIKKKLELLGEDSDSIQSASPVSLANVIFDHIINKSLVSLSDAFDKVFDDDEELMGVVD